MADVFEKKALKNINEPCRLCSTEMISASGISRMCRDCYYREKLTDVILTKGLKSDGKSKKVKLHSDGYFYEVEEDDS